MTTSAPRSSSSRRSRSASNLCRVHPRVAVAYLRASKNEQRLSRAAQRTAIEAWASRERIRVAAWCVDQGVRSISPIGERPALRLALVALLHHAAGVLVVGCVRRAVACDGPGLSAAIGGALDTTSTLRQVSERT
jgi:hypothetical protein